MTFKAALVQMRSGRDMARNFDDARHLIREAAAAGARLVATPEMTNIIEPDRARLRALARPEAEDPSVAGFADLAKAEGIWLNVGSLALKGQGEKLVNRSLLFAPDGSIAARYDKIHLFDVDLPDGQRLRESEAYAGGASLACADTPFGRLGLTICYDSRFPALYQALARRGCGIITVPSAFTVPTGEAHWHVLLRARAIESGCYILAAAQGGIHESGRATFGHSLAVTPWGHAIAEGGTDPGVVVFEVDRNSIELMRSQIPVLDHARAFGLKG